MAFSVECSGCGKRYKIDDRAAGKRVRCKNCGATIEVPLPMPAPQGGDDDPFEALVAMEQNAAPLGGASPPPLPLPPAARPASSRPHYAAMPAPRRARKFGRRTGSQVIGTDSVTPWLIIGYIVTQLGAAIYSSVKVGEVAGDHSRLITAVWAGALINLVLFFAILGPAIYLGVFIMSRIFDAPMVELPYFRGCGVAAVPTLMVVLALLLPRNLILILLVVLAIVPVMFFALRFVFDLDWVGALVSFAFAGLFYLVLQIVSLSILAQSQKSIFNPGSPSQIASAGGGGSSSFAGPSNQAGNYEPPSREELNAHRLQSLSDRINELAVHGGDRSRESLLESYQSLAKQLDGMRAEMGQDPAYASAASSLKTLKTAIDAAPSEHPGPELAQPPPATETWGPGSLDTELLPEVAYRDYAIRPLRTAILNLENAENDPRGIVWYASRRGFGPKLTISSMPNKDPGQKRVWPVTRQFQRNFAELSAIHWVDAINANVTYGKINNLAFTRIESTGPFGPMTKYVGLDGNNWLTIEISDYGNDSQVQQLLDASARTIRKPSPAEPRKSPYAPDAMVARLADDPDHASLILHRMGASAEVALAGGLGASEVRVQRECAKILADVATAQSIPALKQATASHDNEIVESARSALHRLDPAHFNPVTDALADLDGTGRFINKDAVLARLAAMTPDDANRPAVVAKAKEMLAGRDSFFVADAAARVLMTWVNDTKIVPELLPLLDQQGDGTRRRAAMRVLAKLKDKRAVIPILRWLLLDTDPTIESLTQMGPIAEADVAVHLRDKDPAARRNAAIVLRSIGTPRSYDLLNRAAHDQRDLSAREAAQSALDAIKERTTTASTATAPAS